MAVRIMDGAIKERNSQELKAEDRGEIVTQSSPNLHLPNTCLR
jgi:hypothetical protein